nr:hypothetical protein [Beijerinckia mobilis]
MIAAAVQHDDFAPFEELLAVVTDPYADQADVAHYAVSYEKAVKSTYAREFGVFRLTPFSRLSRGSRLFSHYSAA